MNDLEILDRFGPTASEPTPAVLAAARARLDTAISSPAPGRGRRRIPLLVAAAAAAVGIGVLPAFVGSDDSIALASVDPLTFPVTPTWLPEGLGEPHFTSDSSEHGYAVYGPLGDDHIKLVDTYTWDEWEDVTDDRPVEVAGQEARLIRQSAPEVHDVTIAWEASDGDIIGVTGRGKYADPTVVKRVAEGLSDRPMPVDLFLTLAPAGWPVSGYESGVAVSYGKQNELTVILTSSQAGDVLQDFSDWEPVVVDGRLGHLRRGKARWTLDTTAPDGQEFILLAPFSLTEEQVIEVAAGVRHR